MDTSTLVAGRACGTKKSGVSLTLKGQRFIQVAFFPLRAYWYRSRMALWKYRVDKK